MSHVPGTPGRACHALECADRRRPAAAANRRAGGAGPLARAAGFWPVCHRHGGAHAGRFRGRLRPELEPDAARRNRRAGHPLRLDLAAARWAAGRAGAAGPGAVAGRCVQRAGGRIGDPLALLELPAASRDRTGELPADAGAELSRARPDSAGQLRGGLWRSWHRPGLGGSGGARAGGGLAGASGRGLAGQQVERSTLDRAWPSAAIRSSPCSGTTEPGRPCSQVRRCS